MRTCLFVICIFFASVCFAQSPYPGNDSDHGVTVPGFPDPYTGNVSFTTNDIVIAGAVGDYGLSWKRYGSSRSSQSASLFGLGHNWAHNWQWEMLAEGKDSKGRDVISVCSPNGMVSRFTQTSSGEWWSTPSVRHRVISKGNTFTLLQLGGAQAKFERTSSKQGYVYILNELTDTQGNIYKLSFSGNDLIQVTEPAGRWLKIEYKKLSTPNTAIKTPPFKVISRVIASDGQKVSYIYEFPKDADYPVLTKVTYPDKYTAAYIYEEQRPNTRVLLSKADDPHGDSKLRGRMFRYRTESDAALGQILEIKAAEGGAVMQALAADDSDTRGYAIRQTNGATIYQYYNPGGSVSEKIDALGFLTKYDYGDDGRGPIVAETDPLGHVTRHQYNAAGDMVKTIYPDKSVYSWERDDQGRVLKETDELGRSRIFTLDKKGRATKVLHPDGTTEERIYNDFGQLLSLKDTNGGVTKFTLDARGLCTKLIDALGNTYKMIYDDHDLTASTIDPRGKALVFKRDAAGRIIKMIYPDGNSTSVIYDQFGQEIKLVDETGATSEKGYDTFGRQISSYDANGNETRYEYAPIGQNGASFQSPARTTSPSGRVTSVTYDENGNGIAITEAADTQSAKMTLFGYDPNGRQTIVTDALGRTIKNFYDERGRLIKRMTASNFTTSYTYDLAGNKLSEADSKGNTTWKTYDEADREITETDANDQVTSRNYYPSGRLAALTDPNGNLYRYEYDALGHQTALIYPDGSRENTTYDASGKILTISNRSGAIRTFHYDERYREIASEWSDGSQSIVTTYDAAGRVTSRDNGVSKLTYTYDMDGQMTSETQDISSVATGGAFDPAPRTVQYTYTEDGNRESITYPDGSNIMYTYNGNGQLENILDKGQLPAIASYEYDAVGNTVRIPRENLTETSRSFNAENKITQLVEKNPSQNQLSKLDYTYDEEGHRTSTTETLGAEVVRDSYEYDPTYQVIGADYAASVTGGKTGTPESSVDYTYDADGNRQESYADGKVTNYKTNNLNQYTQVDELMPKYDANGNLALVGETVYRYDALNRLIEVSNSKMKAKFAYDAKNRVVVRNYNGQIVLNTYDDWNLIEERDASDWQQARYVYGSRVDEIVVMVNSYGVFYPLYDVLGHVIMLTDGDGKIKERL